MSLRHEVLDVDKGIYNRRHQHALFNLLSLRPVYGQHTRAEEELLAKHAQGARSIVEIGVAEGASAAVLCKAADPLGTVYLVDPYPAGYIPGINFSKLVARLYLRRCQRPKSVVWLQDYSYNVSKNWKAPIEFLFVDGDHAYDKVSCDWRDWSPFVVPGGSVAFHDARLFPGGWTGSDWGPVRLIQEILKKESGWTLVGEVDSLVIVQRRREP